MPYDEAGLLADPDFQAASVARQAQMLGQAGYDVSPDVMTMLERRKSRSPGAAAAVEGLVGAGERAATTFGDTATNLPNKAVATFNPLTSPQRILSNRNLPMVANVVGTIAGGPLIGTGADLLTEIAQSLALDDPSRMENATKRAAPQAGMAIGQTLARAGGAFLPPGIRWLNEVPLLKEGLGAAVGGVLGLYANQKAGVSDPSLSDYTWTAGVPAIAGATMQGLAHGASFAGRYSPGGPLSLQEQGLSQVQSKIADLTKAEPPSKVLYDALAQRTQNVQVRNDNILQLRKDMLAQQGNLRYTAPGLTKLGQGEMILGVGTLRAAQEDLPKLQERVLAAQKQVEDARGRLWDMTAASQQGVDPARRAAIEARAAVHQDQAATIMEKATAGGPVEPLDILRQRASIARDRAQAAFDAYDNSNTQTFSPDKLDLLQRQAQVSRQAADRAERLFQDALSDPQPQTVERALRRSDAVRQKAASDLTKLNAAPPDMSTPLYAAQRDVQLAETHAANIQADLAKIVTSIDDLSNPQSESFGNYQLLLRETNAVLDKTNDPVTFRTIMNIRRAAWKDFDAIPNQPGLSSMLKENLQRANAAAKREFALGEMKDLVVKHTYSEQGVDRFDAGGYNTALVRKFADEESLFHDAFSTKEHASIRAFFNDLARKTADTSGIGVAVAGGSIGGVLGNWMTGSGAVAGIGAAAGVLLPKFLSDIAVGHPMFRKLLLGAIDAGHGRISIDTLHIINQMMVQGEMAGHPLSLKEQTPKEADRNISVEIAPPPGF